MDDTGGVVGLPLKMKSLTRDVSKRTTREKKENGGGGEGVGPPASSVSVSSNNSGEGGGGSRFAVRFCKITKKALMDDTGGVVGLPLNKQ